MTTRRLIRACTAGLGALSFLIGAFAPQALAQEADEVLEEVVVVGSLRSLPTQDVGSVFGFDKSILETPRSASTVSSDQIERFGMSDIDDLVALAPGTFTQSFFGTSGLDVRGTAGETYFRCTPPRQSGQLPNTDWRERSRRYRARTRIAHLWSV